MDNPIGDTGEGEGRPSWDEYVNRLRLHLRLHSKEGEGWRLTDGWVLVLSMDGIPDISISLTSTEAPLLKNGLKWLMDACRFEAKERTETRDRMRKELLDREYGKAERA